MHDERASIITCPLHAPALTAAPFHSLHLHLYFYLHLTHHPSPHPPSLSATNTTTLPCMVTPPMCSSFGEKLMDITGTDPASNTIDCKHHQTQAP